MRHWLLFPCILLVAVVHGKAQNAYWQLTCFDGSVVRKTALLNLHDDTLLISTSDGMRFLNVDSITELRIDRGASFWSGVGLGAGVGSIAGYVVGVGTAASEGRMFPTFNGFIGSVYGILGGGVIGGAIGAINGIDDVYDVSRMTSEKRLATVRQIMEGETTR